MKLLTFLAILTTAFCIDIQTYIKKINYERLQKNAEASAITWELSVNPDINISERYDNFVEQSTRWEQRVCSKLAALENSNLLNATERRMTFLLCRGPQFTVEEALKLSSAYDHLQGIYSEAKVCIPYDKTVASSDLAGIETAILEYIATVKRVLNLETDGVSRAAKLSVYENPEKAVCLTGEEEFNSMMMFSRNEQVLRWLWISWRERVGLPMKRPYRQMVDYQNMGARRNGYTDIGAAWREELELIDLRILCRRLYNHIRPLYTLLHGVIRFHLRKTHGDIVPKRGPIPAHLLGNLWADKWNSIVDLIIPRTVDLDESIKNANWTASDLVRRSEDFYQSIGLPALSDTFWRESVLEKKTPNTRCHGTAADLFKHDDYRLLYCSGASAEDLYVIHHEMGHIHYYIAYEKQPGIYRAANSALHESIGDTIMYGVLTPQHLYRLGLINESMLYITSPPDTATYSEEKTLFPSEDVLKSFNLEEDVNEDWTTEDVNWTTDDILLLKQALNKIPQIPFGLAIDEYSSVIKYCQDDSNEPKLDGFASVTYRVPMATFRLHHQFSAMTLYTCGLWSNYTKGAFSALRVQYNNAFRGLLGLPWRCSASGMFADSGTDGFTAVLRKRVASLWARVRGSPNTLLMVVADRTDSPVLWSDIGCPFMWRYFEGDLRDDALNEEYWALSLELQGIAPPEKRDENGFDAGAKYHVADNTPYIRYFISSFLQHQLFEALCKAAVFGRVGAKEDIPNSIPMHRCDLYGSKAVGKLLRDLMSRGHSQSFPEILKATIGTDVISSSALERYYRPLHAKLAKYVRAHRIPIGW